MIPFLFFGAPPSGGAPGGIVAAPNYRPVDGYDSGDSYAAATTTFTISPNGIWEGTGTGYISQSGNWYLPTTTGAGSAYEVRITPTLTGSSAGSVTNGASSYVALSSARQLKVVSNRFTPGTSVAAYSVKVEIRPAGGGTVVSTGTFKLTATATVFQPGGGGGPDQPPPFEP